MRGARLWRLTTDGSTGGSTGAGRQYAPYFYTPHLDPSGRRLLFITGTSAGNALPSPAWNGEKSRHRRTCYLRNSHRAQAEHAGLHRVALTRGRHDDDGNWNSSNAATGTWRPCWERRAGSS